MVGLAPANVEMFTMRGGFDLDVRWSERGKILPRLRAATVGRMWSASEAMSELEAAKDRAERELAETQRAQRRLEALLAVGRSVERGLDIHDLIRSFSLVARAMLGVRLLHVSLFEDAEDEASWKALAVRASEQLANRSMGRVTLPTSVDAEPPGVDSAWALSLDGPGGRMGVAFVAAAENLDSLPSVDGELLTDACNRLSHALGNALRHQELSAYGEKLERQVRERTAQIGEQANRLQASNDKLVEVDRAKRRFFTHLSHELRTPATLLSASLEQLEGRVPREDASANDAFVRARRNMARVVYAVDDLLDLAQLDEGKMVLASGIVDARKLVLSLASSIEPWATSSQVAIVTEVPEHDVSLVGDARLLEKAVLNLIANAVKFSPPGETVSIVVDAEGEGVCFRVRDSGPGVSAEDRDRIFGAFEQADHRGSEQGIGIGLSLVNEIATLHGGEARHADRVPCGSEFTMWLPRGKDAESHEGSVRSPRGAAGTARERAEALLGAVQPEPKPADQEEPTEEAVWSAAPRPTVLVVDDEPEIRTVLRDRLLATYNVVTASCGSEALDIVDGQVPSAVLADVTMPGMTGFELCRRLRERLQMRHVPILLITALGSVEDKLRGFEVGADDYVTKPFSFREVEARLATQLQLRRMAAEMNAMSAASMIGSVAAGVVHEINNPLNVLLNALPPVSEVFEAEECDKDTARLMLELSMESAHRIHECVSSLSSLASWSSAKPETVDIGDFVAAVVRQHAQRGGGTTEISVHGRVEREVGLLRTEAAMVIGNLLANAIDAAGPGGHVEIVLSEQREEAIISVRDDGPGMDAASLRKALEPFFTTKEPGKGMGLGLFLVQQLLRRLGGRLEARSLVGKGTQMTVAFPFAPPRTE